MSWGRGIGTERTTTWNDLYGLAEVWLSLPFSTKLTLFTSIFKPALNIYTVSIWNKGKILLLPSWCYLGRQQRKFNSTIKYLFFLKPLLLSFPVCVRCSERWWRCSTASSAPPLICPPVCDVHFVPLTVGNIRPQFPLVLVPCLTFKEECRPTYHKNIFLLFHPSFLSPSLWREVSLTPAIRSCPCISPLTSFTTG